MEENTTLRVIDSDLGRIPAGVLLTVRKDRTNQFSGQRTLLVVAENKDVPGRISGFQIFQMPDSTPDVWKEIVVGRDSDTIVVEETNRQL